MSLFYGTHWTIDGVTAGPITRNYLGNGQYAVIFEREYASLEQIEGINWAKPSIEHIGIHGNEDGLPEGYGFKVVDIEYYSSTRSYRVTVKTDSQYLGDVTGYQDQIDQLESASAEKDETISAQASQLQEQADTISQKDAELQQKEDTITQQAATIGQKDTEIQQKEDTIAEQAATITEQTKTLGDQAATIQSQAEQIKTLEASGGGAAITAKLEAAYTEGVESNG